jgi:hypothetical protein
MDLHPEAEKSFLLLCRTGIRTERDKQMGTPPA